MYNTHVHEWHANYMYIIRGSHVIANNTCIIQSGLLPDLEFPNTAMIDIMEFLLKILEEIFNWLI